MLTCYLETAKVLREGLNVWCRITSKKAKFICREVQKYVALSAEKYIKVFHKKVVLEGMSDEGKIQLSRILISVDDDIHRQFADY